LPYGGTTKEQDSEIDACISSPKWVGKINSRTGKPYTQEEKIAICKSKATSQSVVNVDDRYYMVSNVGEDIKACQCDVTLTRSMKSDEVVDDSDGFFDKIAQSKRLTYQERQNLKDSDFCLITVQKRGGKTIKDRRFPAHDETHVRNGLQQLPKANLTPSQRTQVRSCLIKRAKKYGITTSSNADIKTDTSTSVLEMLVDTDYKVVVPEDDGSFVVMAGMEGQRSFNPYTGEIFYHSRKFFENVTKAFIGTHYYPNHENVFNVEKSVAKVVDAWNQEIEYNGETVLAMFHRIIPRNEAARKDIEDGFYDDVSIDVGDLISSPNDEYVMDDATPLGTAFVSGARPFQKGCPICKVVHEIGSSCITNQSPSGTPDVPRHKEHSEETTMSENEKPKDAPPAQEEEGVSEKERLQSTSTKPDVTQAASKSERLTTDDRVAALEHELAMGQASKILASVFDGDDEGLAQAMAAIEGSPDILAAAKSQRDLVKHMTERSVVLASASQGRISPVGDDGSSDDEKHVKAAYEHLMASQTGNRKWKGDA